EASRALVRRIAANCDDRVLARVCEDAVVVLERPSSVARELDRLEQALFDAAAPQPIEHEPTRAARGAREPRVIRLDDTEVQGAFPRIRAALASVLDGRVTELVDAAVSSLSRLRRQPSAGRGRVWIVAGAAAALVVVAG